MALIATLPPDQAEVVMLRVVAGLDVTEVARILGKRPGTVRVLAHRGLRRLAQRLAAGDLPRSVTR
jgi:RNA polymerase sigma-70 factor (ECF subfamily)